MHKLIQNIKSRLSGQFLRNAGWLGSAELANRVFRIGTTVTLGRMFSPQDFGLMAIIYTTFEFATILPLKGGIGSKIIQAPEAELPLICDTAYWLNWLVCGGAFCVQCAASIPIAQIYGDSRLILPICCVALMYLIYPFFLVQSALITRENRLKVIALCNATHSFMSNVITVLLALLGFGIWSIVWAMLLSLPAWVVITTRNHSWQPPKSFTLKGWRSIFGFSKNILGTEILTKLRNNLDYLIVGGALGVNELGLYYFAFNAGSGITMNVVNVLMTALFPHLCTAQESLEKLKIQFMSSMKTIALCLVPLVLLQSALAPFYVPIVFGEKWTPAIPVLIVICLSVLPQAFKMGSSLLLNAIGETRLPFYFDLGFTILFTVALFIAVGWGVLPVAFTVLILHLLVSLAFCAASIRYVFVSKRALTH